MVCSKDTLSYQRRPVWYAGEVVKMNWNPSGGGICSLKKPISHTSACIQRARAIKEHAIHTVFQYCCASRLLASKYNWQSPVIDYPAGPAAPIVFIDNETENSILSNLPGLLEAIS